MAAAAVACGLAFPARRRLEEWANQRVYGELHSPDEALRTFGGRMSRAVPMDELLLQLVESLKKSMHLIAAEIWAGQRRPTVPHGVGAGTKPGEPAPPGRGAIVVARAHAQGNAWMQVWVPALLEGRDGSLVRSVSVAHLGDLLGLIVLERPTTTHRSPRRRTGCSWSWPARSAWRCTTSGSTPRCRRRSTSCRCATRNSSPPRPASSPPPTSPAARSSGTCTTVRSNTWWPWP